MVALSTRQSINHVELKTKNKPKAAGSKDFDGSQYKKDPVGFIQDKLGVTLTPEQIEIAESVCDRRETNVQAAHGVGKTFLAAQLVLWWVLSVGGEAITTAPTARQVETLLWKEIRKVVKSRQLPGLEALNLTDYKITEHAKAWGFTANDRNSNAFQGVHAQDLLVVEDEACGISQEIDDGAVSCVTGSENRIVRIGNPITPNNPFQDACARNHIRLPVWTHPNVAWAYERDEDGIHRLKPEVAEAIIDPVTGEILPQSQWPEWCPRDVIPGAISVYYIEETARPRGEGSSFWQSRIEGLFPEDSAQSVIPRSYFIAARQRYDQAPKDWDEISDLHSSRFGLDVGDGGDPHALARWCGPVLYSIAKMPTRGDMLDANRAAGMSSRQMKAYPGSGITIDRGFGSGVIGILKEQELNAHGVHWGQAARDNKTYLNAKAEDFWLLREALRKGEVAIAPLGDLEDELMDDLAGTYFEETSAGKIKIEKKELTRERLKRSPDCGDATVFGFRQLPKPPKKHRVRTASNW